MNSLKKLWKGYKVGQAGERSYYAWKIAEIQKHFGLLERSTFPELEGTEDEDQGLTDEELQLRREEKEEESGIGGRDSEWSEEDKQLLKEELEAEKEYDW